MKKILQLFVVLLIAVFSTPLAVVFLIVRTAWSFSGDYVRNIHALIRNQD